MPRKFPLCVARLRFWAAGGPSLALGGNRGALKGASFRSLQTGRGDAMRIRTVVGVVCLFAVTGCGVELEPVAEEPAQMDTKKVLRADRPVEGRWIVVLDDEQPDVQTLRGQAFHEFARDMATREPGAQLGLVFGSALRGFSASMTEEQAIELSQDPRVRYVEEVSRVEI